ELSEHLADPVLRAYARGLSGHWIVSLRGWSSDDSRALAEAVEVLRRANQRAPLGGAVTLDAYHRCHRSEYRAACEAAAEGVQLGVEVGDAYYYMSCQFFQAWALLHLGAWGEALRLTRDGLRMAEKNGHCLGVRAWQFMLAWLHEQAFDFQRARELCEPAVRPP